jgi:hypothetical protein
MIKHTAANPHWSVERNLAGTGWIRLVATEAGTCAAPCDRYGNIIETTKESKS